DHRDSAREPRGHRGSRCVPLPSRHLRDDGHGPDRARRPRELPHPDQRCEHLGAGREPDRDAERAHRPLPTPEQTGNMSNLIVKMRTRTWRKRDVWAIHVAGMSALAVSYMFGAAVLLGVAVVGGTSFLLVATPMTDLDRRQVRHEVRFRTLLRDASYL